MPCGSLSCFTHAGIWTIWSTYYFKVFSNFFLTRKLKGHIFRCLELSGLLIAYLQAKGFWSNSLPINVYGEWSGLKTLGLRRWLIVDNPNINDRFLFLYRPGTKECLQLIKCSAIPRICTKNKLTIKVITFECKLVEKLLKK